MEIKDRQGNIILSDKGQDNMLERLYRTVGGSIALKGLTAPLVSKAAGPFLRFNSVCETDTFIY